jgi:hypothetical protein
VALMMVMLAMSVAPAFARGGPSVGGPSMSCLAAVFSDYKAPICPGVYHPGGQP